MKLFLIALLVLSSGPAYAEWKFLVTSSDGASVYVDLDTIRRKGNLVKLWLLWDSKKPREAEGKSYLSSRDQWQVDCEEERYRVLASTWYSGTCCRVTGFSVTPV
jgi:hypothetical protein